LSVVDPKSLDEGAEHQPLREGGHARAVAEGVVPERLVLRVAKTEFKGDAAEDERQQHDQYGEIHRRDDDGESERKGGPEPDAAENQPGLVAVPDRRDRVHDRVARGCVGREAEQHADAEIEAVEQDIEEHRRPEEQCP
jgi:hypothetical protein